MTEIKGGIYLHKVLISLATITLLTLSILVAPMAQAETDGVNTTVELTKEQKDELASLHKNVLDQHIGIINKYVELGVFTEEKGNKMISFMEKHYAELEKNDYIPKCDKKHRKSEE